MSTKTTGRFVADQSVSSIEDLREAVRDADVEARQLSAESVKGDLLHVAMGDLVLTQGTFGGTVELQGPLSPDCLTLGVLLDAAEPSSQWLQEIRVRDVGIFAPGQEHLALYRVKTCYSAFTIHEDDLMLHAEREGYRFNPSTLRSSRMLGTGLEAWKASLRIGRLARRNPDLLKSAAVSRELRSQLLNGYLEVLARAGGQETESRNAPGHAASIVADARAIIDCNAHRLVTVDELACALSVPRRSLHRAFVDVLGLPPAAYLRFYRLNGARRELKHRDASGDGVVTKVATSWGFNELGRFSAQYRAMFGELPSKTAANFRRTA